jgi:YVTN family beta-propeller protein
MGQIAVMSTNDNSVLARIALHGDAVGLATTPDGSRLYVALAQPAVEVINTETNAAIAEIGIPGSGIFADPAGVVITRDGRFVYVENVGSNSVSVIATSDNAVIATIPVGANPFTMGITPDGAHIYVANTGTDGSGSVSVISTFSNTVVSSIDLGSAGFCPYGATVSPDGSLVYITTEDPFNSGTASLTAINTVTNTVASRTGIGNITCVLGGLPRDLAISPDGTVAYISNGSSSSISVINLPSGSLVSTIPLGGSPIFVTFATIRPSSGCQHSSFSGSFPDSGHPQLLDFHNGWIATAQVSDRDGLEVSDVSLNTRYMAVEMSLPYYLLNTSSFPSARCELTPSSITGTPCGGRLIDFKQTSDTQKASLEATYEVDGISPDPDTCLVVTQRYEFWNPVDPSANSTAACEPTETLRCARFKPIIDYQFIQGTTADQLKSINTVQRLHFAPDSNSASASASTLIHDCNVSEIISDGLLALGSFVTGSVPNFDCISAQFSFLPPPQLRVAPLRLLQDQNPLATEAIGHAISNGQAGSWDNFHETSLSSVLQPALVLAQLDLTTLISGNGFNILWKTFVGGCPECVHIHWRWGDGVKFPAPPRFVPLPQFNNGSPLIPNGSNQSIEFAVVRFHSGEEHPDDFHSLIDSPPETLIGQPQVFWYSASSSQPSDQFFTHGGFFSPDPDTPAGSNISVQPVDSSTATAPVVLTFDNIIQGGTTALDISTTGPPPPKGFVGGVPEIFYDPRTTALFSGSIRVCINFAPVIFANPASVKLFHFEGTAWIDRTTTLDPSNTTVCGSVSSLSPFAIFAPVDSIPPVTTSNVIPTPNANGWNNSKVTVSLTSTDNEPGGTGVKEIHVSLAGAQSSTNVVPGSTASVLIFAEGTTIVSYFGVDNAGNAEPTRSLKIQIDKTPPSIVGMPLSGCTLLPPNHKLVEVATVSASDSLSGLATFVVNAVSSENNADSDPAVVITGDNLQPQTVQLRAERFGNGLGRFYMIASTATDVAGNSTTASAACIFPHDEGH